MTPYLLFVCTGNTCRSPMAEALAEAGVGVEYRNYEEMIHGFFTLVSSSEALAVRTHWRYSRFMSSFAQSGADLSP